MPRFLTKNPDIGASLSFCRCQSFPIEKSALARESKFINKVCLNSTLGENEQKSQNSTYYFLG